MKRLALTTCTVGFACGVYAGLNGWPFGWVAAVVNVAVGALWVNR